MSRRPGPASSRPWPFEPFEAIAHRGGAWEAPENSRMAFRRAVDLGYRFLETDVRATADGVPVIFHDASLDRTTSKRGRIADLPWAEVRAARIHGRQPIMTLEQLLEEFPDTRFNLDLKEPAAVEPFVAVVRRMNAWDRLVVGSFSHDRLQRARRVGGPRLATSLSPPEVFRLWLAARGRGGRYRPPPATCVQVPPSAGGRRVVEPRLVSMAHGMGWHVHVWTIDQATVMEELIELGVDGLMTDRPTLLRQVLRQRGLWRE
ncbi:MAG: glycerophosphodiester phosphodiesterase [Candidatus Nanopelagicales bacterium]